MNPIALRAILPSPHRSPERQRPPADAPIARLGRDAWVSSRGDVLGFTDHLKEAIHSNTARRDYYDRASNGASRSLSNHVIRLERLTLPFAWLFDARANRYNRQGIGIVDGDFVPMTGIRPPETPPTYRNVAAKADFKRLDGWLDRYRDEVGAALDRRDFRGIAALTDTLLTRIDGLEAAAGAHFAMTKHVAESVGYAALHALDYRARSGGRTDDLAARFVQLQAFGLTGTLSIDRRAQELHRQGIGIIVNDLPHIPFQAEWARTAR